MHGFQELCHALKKAVTLTEEPKFVIQPGRSFLDPFGVQGKVKYLHDRYSAKLEQRKRYEPSCIGHCSIDSFTGFELLKILYSLLEKQDPCEPGDYVCFSINGEARAAIEIYNSVSYTVAAGFSTEDEKFKRMFTKLFDDDEIHRQRNEYPEKRQLYLQEDINRYRLKAKNDFPLFLKQKFSDFVNRNKDGVIQMQMWNSFFGLLVNIAKRTSKKGNLESVSSNVPRIGCIPYLACVKFAFDINKTGIITKLFGETGTQETNNKTEINQCQAQCIVDTAKHLILM